MTHPFEVLHIYDPSIWYSDGEVTNRLKQTKDLSAVKIHLTYQPKPAFHKQKIEEFITELQTRDNVELTIKLYESESHNSLFIDSFYQGIMKTNK